MEVLHVRFHMQTAKAMSQSQRQKVWCIRKHWGMRKRYIKVNKLASSMANNSMKTTKKCCYCWLHPIFMPPHTEHTWCEDRVCGCGRVQVWVEFRCHTFPDKSDLKRELSVSIQASPERATHLWSGQVSHFVPVLYLGFTGWFNWPKTVHLWLL